MTTERDSRTRIVLSWLREDAHENAERMLLRALDEVDATPQRRSSWPAWRSNSMNTYAKLIAAAAAVLVVAVAGYQLLPGRGGGGTPTVPSAAPSPTPALLARGSFVAGDDVATELDATLTGDNEFDSPGDRTDVAGTMIVQQGGRIAVDLDCARMGDDGVLVIGGTVSDSTNAAFPEDSLFAIILQRGTPVRASFMFGATSDGPCMTFTQGGLAAALVPGLRPIQGTVTLGP